jgi:hypothetical protein
MKETGMNCPNGHGKMLIKRASERIKFRGVSVKVPVEQYVCPVCGVKAGTIKQTAAIQK